MNCYPTCSNISEFFDHLSLIADRITEIRLSDDDDTPKQMMFFSHTFGVHRLV
jgi:hypothetical protein